jgi:hypothetical protein
VGAPGQEDIKAKSGTVTFFRRNNRGRFQEKWRKEVTVPDFAEFGIGLPAHLNYHKRSLVARSVVINWESV